MRGEIGVMKVVTKPMKCNEIRGISTFKDGQLIVTGTLGREVLNTTLLSDWWIRNVVKS